MSTIQVIEEGGEFTAFDEETGTEARGETKSIALLELAVALRDSNAEVEPAAIVRDESETSAAEFEELCEDVQRRFEQHDVSEEDVEDAIEWARQR